MAVLRSVWRWIAGGFAAAVLLLGLATGLFRLLVPTLPEYRQQIEAWASAALDVPVTIGSYDLRWSLSGPQLVFYDGELWTPDRSERVLHADGGAVRLSLLDLAGGRIRPSSVMLRGAQINIERAADGSWRVLGRELPAVSGAGGTSVLPRGRLELRDATVIVADGNGPPLRLSGVRLEFERGNDYLRVDSALDLPEQRDGHLELVVQTDVGNQNHWQLYVRGQRFDLALLTRLVPPLRDRLRGGAADLTLWASLDGRRLEEGSVVLDAERLALAAANGTAADYDRLRGRFGWARLPGGWRVHGDDVMIDRGGHPWPETSFSVDVDDGGGVRAAQAGYLRLEDLDPLLAWLPHGGLQAEASALAARGEVQDFAFQRVGAGSEVTLHGYFTNLGFEATVDRPGAVGLTGSVRMDDDGGRLELASSRVVLEWPAFFRAALPPAELRGALSWRRQPQGWRVLSEELLLATADLRSRAQLELALPADGTSPVIDLQVAVEDMDVASANRYLPAGRMPPRVVEWLDAALRRGRIVSASATLRGPLRAFPFDGGEGELRARLQFEDAVLAYWPGWPEAEGIEGTVEFYNTRLSGQVRAAMAAGNRVAPALVNIADLREGLIEYTGHSSGDVDALLGFLRASGLARRAPTLEKGLEGSGPSELDLDFSLPVRRMDGTRVRATLHLDDATIGMAGLRQRFERVQGALEYSDAGLRGEGLRALFLGRPVDVSLTPQRAEDGHVTATLLDLEGRFDAIDLGAGLDERLGRLLSGSSMYRARARLPQDQSELEIDVHSDFAGTEIRLPPPLAKAADAPAALSVHTRFAAADRAFVDVTVGEQQRALVETARPDGAAWRFVRASVELSGDAPQLAEPAGIAVHGRVAAVDLERWLAFDADSGSGNSLLSFLDLQIDDLLAFDEHFAGVHAELDRNDREWLVQLDSADLRGSLFVPLDERSGTPLVAKLDALHLRSSESGDDEATDPRKLMPMHVDVADFSYGDMKFGQLALELAPVTNGVQVTHLATAAPGFAIDGQGHWLLDEFGHRSQLDFTLKSTDVKTTLTALAFESSLSAADGEVVASVSWPGPPGPRFREQLTGEVKIRVGKGQLESVQPGAGRMFGLLSVAALPRRLSLDFRDVFDKGLGFDEIRGDFTLDGGNAFTNNLVLEGPAADVGIVGRTGMVARDYDQTAVVYANFGSSLPVAGALAAGPAVGAALLLFSEIFKKPLKAMSSQHYRITGSWDDPLVERMAPAGAPAAAESAEGARNASVPKEEPLAEQR